MPNMVGFDALLTRMKNIMSGQLLTGDSRDTMNFLNCSYGLFSGWKNNFSLTNLQRVGVSGFASYIYDFLPESGNGS